jgi:hypothetical protein
MSVTDRPLTAVVPRVGLWATVWAIRRRGVAGACSGPARRLAPSRSVGEKMLKDNDLMWVMCEARREGHGTFMVRPPVDDWRPMTPGVGGATGATRAVGGRSGRGRP